ncbi:MAG: 50S ribosomal protein L32 [Planctomycetales bacterium]|nr:50S ribosomal protein L32 [Planctomycetales bacterium]
MAVPKRRQSKGRSRRRRSHDAIKVPQLHHCQQCQTRIQTHVICPTCGYYMGRQLLEVEE